MSVTASSSTVKAGVHEPRERREFTIALGNRRLTVEGVVVGPLGVHPTSTGWRISHLASGWKITGPRDFLEKDDALAVAESLKDENWSGSRTAVQRRRGLKAKVFSALSVIPDDRKTWAGEP